MHRAGAFRVRLVEITADEGQLRGADAALPTSGTL